MRARRGARILGIAFLAATTAAAAASGAERAIVVGNDAPAWSPDGRRIAFTSFRHGNGEIYVMRSDGSAASRLTRTAAHDDHAAWSPDGTKLAFASTRDGNYEIYVMNADGSAQRRLTDNAASDYLPTWSPDGREIAWQSDRGGDFDIYADDVRSGRHVTVLVARRPDRVLEPRRRDLQHLRDGRRRVRRARRDERRDEQGPARVVAGRHEAALRLGPGPPARDHGDLRRRRRGRQADAPDELHGPRRLAGVVAGRLALRVHARRHVPLARDLRRQPRRGKHHEADVDGVPARDRRRVRAAARGGPPLVDPAARRGRDGEADPRGDARLPRLDLRQDARTRRARRRVRHRALHVDDSGGHAREDDPRGRRDQKRGAPRGAPVRAPHPLTPRVSRR